MSARLQGRRERRGAREIRCEGGIERQCAAAVEGTGDGPTVRRIGIERRTETAELGNVEGDIRKADHAIACLEDLVVPSVGAGAIIEKQGRASRGVDFK